MNGYGELEAGSSELEKYDETSALFAESDLHHCSHPHVDRPAINHSGLYRGVGFGCARESG